MPTLLPNAKQTFTGPGGTPLSSGSVYFYIPNTTTPKATYQDPAQTILNANPVLLDANGQAIIWGSGTYRQVVYDANNNLIWDQITEDTSGGLLGDMTDNTFTASGGGFVPGTTTQLTLSSFPGSAANTWVYFDGVYQAPDAWSVSNKTVTFNTPIPVGVQEVNIKAGSTIAIGTPGSGTVTDSSVASGSKLYNRINDLNDIKDSGAVVNGTTDDTTSIINAIAKGPTFFPSGIALTTASIANFHSTIKTGPGAVKRGTNTFYISPTNSQTNTLFVSPTGSDTNDGLSDSQPFQTIQAALNALSNYGPSLSGTWVIQLAAGTYSTTTGATMPEGLEGPNRVIIQGPIVNHPNVPTAIIDGGGVAHFGLNFNGGNFVELSNILIQNCTTYGWVAQDFCNIYTINVHCYNINAVSGAVGHKMQQGRLYMDGGITQNCQIGIECISQVTFTVGESASNLSQGPIIQNCTQAGALIQENSTGHFNYVTVNNCVVGFDIVEKSRINAVGCLIENNTGQGVRTRLGSSWLNSSCTLSGNLINETNYSFSTEVNNGNLQYSSLWSVIDSTAATLTGTTVQTQMKSYSPGIKANSFVWPGRTHKIVITGQFFGSGGTKTIVCQAGGNLIHGATSVNGSTGQFRYEGTLFAQDSADQSYSVTLLDSFASTPNVQSATHNINMATGSDMGIAITGQLSSSSDQITIRTVEIIETATP